MAGNIPHEDVETKTGHQKTPSRLRAIICARRTLGLLIPLSLCRDRITDESAKLNTRAKDSRASAPDGSSRVKRRVLLGEYEIDLEAWELRKGERRVKRQDQPLRILGVLFERPGELSRGRHSKTSFGRTIRP